MPHQLPLAAAAPPQPRTAGPPLRRALRPRRFLSGSSSSSPSPSPVFSPPLSPVSPRAPTRLPRGMPPGLSTALSLVAPASSLPSTCSICHGPLIRKTLCTTSASSPTSPSPLDHHVDMDENDDDDDDDDESGFDDDLVSDDDGFDDDDDDVADDDVGYVSDDELPSFPMRSTHTMPAMTRSRPIPIPSLPSRAGFGQQRTLATAPAWMGEHGLRSRTSRRRAGLYGCGAVCAKCGPPGPLEKAPMHTNDVPVPGRPDLPPSERRRNPYYDERFFY